MGLNSRTLIFILIPDRFRILVRYLVVAFVRVQMTLYFYIRLKLEDKYMPQSKTKLLQQILLHKFLVDNSNNINNDRIDMSTATESVMTLSTERAGDIMIEYCLLVTYSHEPHITIYIF